MDARSSSAGRALDARVASPPRGSSRRWTSASELGAYEFCPRAWWYDAHPPALGPSEASRQAARRGERFHARSLDGERARERWAGLYALLLLAAVGLLLVGLTLIGALGALP